MRSLIIPSISEDLAEETGLHIGDGSMNFYNGNGFYQLRGHIEDDKAHYATRIKPLYSSLYGFEASLRDMPSTRVHGFQLWSNELVYFKARVLELPLGPKGQISIPGPFLSKMAMAKAVIRGVFDTDGCLYLEKKPNRLYPRIEITTISQILMQQIRKILCKLDFSVCLCSFKSKDRSRAYRIITRGDKMLNKWFNEICPANPKFTDKLNYYLDNS